ncbi:MAG: hypothetical protein JXQ87_08660 [Bacteroidia bacterium]
MKNLIALLSLSALIVLGGCKRGEEDPAIAFSSRDGRIAGEWSLTTGSIVNKQTKVNSVEGSSARTVTVTTESYDIASSAASYARNLTVNDIKQGEDVGYNLDFEMFLNIQKDASYVNTFSGEFVGANGFPLNLVDKSSGFWSWINSDKNKVGINFKSIDSYANELLSGDYKIKRLSGSELILVRNAVSSSEAINSGSSETDEFSSVIELSFTKN